MTLYTARLNGRGVRNEEGKLHLGRRLHGEKVLFKFVSHLNLFLIIQICFLPFQYSSSSCCGGIEMVAF